MHTESIIRELKTRHGCHTVVLYGSRAWGEPEETSDYDVIGIRDGGTRERDARVFEDGYLDAFIYPREALEGELEPEMVRLRHGKVLVEKDGFGTALVARARRLFEAGPRPLPPSEAQLLRSWTIKTLARVSRGGPDDIEANYRRVWLLFDLLEIYFKLRGKWYLGPKESFAWLRDNDPASFALFDNALKPDAPRGAVRILADRVIS